MCEKSLTELGNPAKPQGKAGEEMLRDMNLHHYNVTGWALDFFEFTGGEKVLDIGCGGGETLKRMAEKITSGHLTGADYSEVSVKLSRENNAESIESGKMDIVLASVEDLPFENGTFDKIITVESFYFWSDPQENLREVHRVLKNGGKFLLVADIYGGAELTEQDIENIKKYDLYNPTPSELETLLVNAGFSDVKIHLKENTTWICAEAGK